MFFSLPPPPPPPPPPPLSQAEQPASRQQVMAFVQQLFDFVEGALAAGSSVLIHCLAGAHRAGTTGCLLLMHKTGLGADQASKYCKGKGYHGLDDFGTPHMTAVLGPHDLPTTSLTYGLTLLLGHPHRPGDAYGPGGAPCDQPHRRAAQTAPDLRDGSATVKCSA